MTVFFYTLNKRDNSTFRPVSNGIEVNGILRNSSSVTSPTIDFQIENPLAYNYFYIPLFNRYYWLSDWTRNDALWTASMTVDVLASWKNEIGESVQYVTRSSAEYDSAIIDELYTTKTKPITQSVLARIPGWGSTIYVAGVIGNGENAAVTYYFLTQEQFTSFSNYLMGGEYLQDLDFGQLTLDYIKAIYNPFQYVVSVMAFPIGEAATSPKPIAFGWWVAPAQGSPFIFNTTFRVVFDMEVPKHPQGEYHNSNQFSKYTLHHPLFGDLPLDADVLSNYNSFKIEIEVDPVSGYGYLTAYTLSSTDVKILLGFTTAQVGQPVQISQISAGNLLSAAGSIFSIANAALSKDFLGSVTGVGNALKSVFPSMQTKGCNGNTATFKDIAVELNCIFYIQADSDSENHGKPLCKVKKLNTIPGYIICEQADISAPATSFEIEKIKAFLNGGFFYE